MFENAWRAEKMMAGDRVWPVLEYVMKERTAAKTAASPDASSQHMPETNGGGRAYEWRPSSLSSVESGLISARGEAAAHQSERRTIAR